MTNRSNRPRGPRRGFTMVELAVAMVLAAFLMFLAAAMINLAAVGAAGGDVRTTLAREDAAFAAKLNDTIQKSTVAFTVPEQSFTVEKLDQGWNYLGLMDNVKIPAFVSLTGEETTAQALVYIEYVGTTRPAGATPSDCNLLQNNDGYFYQKVLGHAFTDTAGLTHTYSLTFEPTNSINAASQSIIYNLTSTITNASGQVVGAGDVSGLEIDTMLNNLNAIQVVYRGSASNPAVALAFRPFMPVSDSSHIVSNQPKGTVVLVLDYSKSMTVSYLGNKSRFDALREAVEDLCADLAVNDQVTVIPVPFAKLAYDTQGVNIPTQKWYTPANSSDFEGLKKILGGSWEWQPGSDETNMGDGLRVARVVTQQYKSTLPDGDLGELFLIVVSDGTNSTRTINWQTDQPYTGTEIFNSYYYYGDTSKNHTQWYPTFGTNNPRQPREYMKDMAQQFKNQFNPTTFLLDVSGGDLRAEDKQALTAVFGTNIIDVDNLTAFEEAFEEITLGIESVLWAFEGPEL